ncbi:LON peptidase substrate-binding domain-containing protein [Paludisphaera borealis]|uniref:Lon protease n=1 Tax=Paludisphaera borealis TaxID=1387353 RepID=A0A1U7CJP5_9BACT|nr:LON peptidase substrate-binding domain-containing protein [Paludisphaera borealis]APW59128.1 Lon protease [Paludisphaera borealis]
MDDDLDLRDFSDVTRLFPLPKVVLFPHVVLPLHIFEPRYRQMTEDALADDRLITIVQLKTVPDVGGWTEPAAVEEVGCLGKIIRHERLADGRFNLLLLGRKRVRLRCEPPSGRLYRVAEVDVLDDLAPGDSEAARRAGLVDLFRRVVGREHALDPDFSKLLNASAPLGVLVDVMAHALSLPIELKQSLLNEPSVEKRCGTIQELLERLEQIAGSAPRTHPFPPDFSLN